MLKRLKNVLILDDHELECNCTNLTIDKIDISTIAIATASLDEFDMIIYNGKLGMKVIKSCYTKTGIVGE